VVRADRDFAAYVGARGPTVVRCLVLLGLSAPEAEQVAAEAFASLQPDWADVSSSGDVAEILFATTLGTDAETTAALIEEAATLPPLLLPYERVRAVVARRRRRQRLTAGSVVAVAAVVALVWSLVEGAGGHPAPPEDDGLGPVHVSAGGRDAGVVWWADGTLHLAAADLEVGDVRRVVAAGDAAAYVDGRGRLVAAYPDGHRILLGHPTRHSALVSSEHGLVAWIDATDPEVERLVVWDVPAERRLARVVVTGALVHPIGFDGGWLTFRSGTTDWVWNPWGGEPRKTGDGAPKADGDEWSSLVDTVAGTRLEQVGLAMRVVHARSGRTTWLPGTAGSLSSDGRRVIVQPVDGGEPRLYDARTGDRLDAGTGGGGRILDATFVDDDRVAWLVDRADGHAVVVVCGSPGEPMDCDPPDDLGATGTTLIARDTLG
jgi:hypothetical protein